MPQAPRPTGLMGTYFLETSKRFPYTLYCIYFPPWVGTPLKLCPPWSPEPELDSTDISKQKNVKNYKPREIQKKVNFFQEPSSKTQFFTEFSCGVCERRRRAFQHFSCLLFLCFLFLFFNSGWNKLFSCSFRSLFWWPLTTLVKCDKEKLFAVFSGDRKLNQSVSFWAGNLRLPVKEKWLF